MSELNELQELESVDSQTALDISELEGLGMSIKDMKDFFRWASGSISEPPEPISKMMVNLSNKLSVGLGINIIGNIGRQTRLTKFLEELESTMYDPARIPEMSEEEKVAAYKEARKTSDALFEAQRKFIAQNKENFNPETSEQQKLLSRIMTLPADKLAQIVDILDGKVVEQQVDTTSSDIDL